MICSARGLGLGDDHTGILVLDEQDLEPGSGAAPSSTSARKCSTLPSSGSWLLPLDPRQPASGTSPWGQVHDPVDRPVPLKHERLSGRAAIRGLPAVCCAHRHRDRSRSAQSSLACPPRPARRMRSISVAVDITNYVMLETGQPIHAYDADLLDGPIVVQSS